MGDREVPSAAAAVMLGDAGSTVEAAAAARLAQIQQKYRVRRALLALQSDRDARQALHARGVR